jgi:hypothetical protein
VHFWVALEVMFFLFFSFNFCGVLKWWLSRRIFCQFWWYSKCESRKFLRPFHVVGNCGDFFKQRIYDIICFFNFFCKMVKICQKNHYSKYVQLEKFILKTIEPTFKSKNNTTMSPFMCAISNMNPIGPKF